MNVIVCGTRKAWEGDGARYGLEEELKELFPITRIIHGDCPNSPDQWADQFASERDIEVERFPYVSELGKAGGNFRNGTMANYAASLGDAHCIAVWDGKSSGTLDMIKKAVKKGIPVSIVPAKVP